MNAQFESRGTVEEFDETTAARLLSYLDVMELRVDVLKKRRSLTERHVDERFAEAITFCEKMCGKVDLKSLSLRSQNPDFAWCMGKESMKRLSSFQNLESLSLENMVEADVLDYVEVVVDLKKLSNIRMRLDARHLGEVEGIRWVNIQGRLFTT
uniref:RNI-like superfamily protein n=1 Tax=Angiostrongylus cantonensis TaxID=6313 RepID=A0A0K0DNZ4_ANGCA